MFAVIFTIVKHLQMFTLTPNRDDCIYKNSGRKPVPETIKQIKGTLPFYIRNSISRWRSNDNKQTIHNR